MAIPIAKKFDERFFACIRKAWILRLGTDFELLLESRISLPPNWLSALTVTLLHQDEQTQVTCHARWFISPGCNSTAKITPVDTNVQLADVFGIPGNMTMLKIKLVVITGSVAQIVLPNATCQQTYNKRRYFQSFELID